MTITYTTTCVCPLKFAYGAALISLILVGDESYQRKKKKKPHSLFRRENMHNSCTMHSVCHLNNARQTIIERQNGCAQFHFNRSLAADSTRGNVSRQPESACFCVCENATGAIKLHPRRSMTAFWFFNTDSHEQACTHTRAHCRQRGRVSTPSLQRDTWML